jgi:hypothetical protein
MFFQKFIVILVLSVLSLPAILSSVESNDVGNRDIEEMMIEAESRALKPSTVVKVGVLYSAALYLLTYFFPAAFGIAARSARMASPFDFDYVYVQKSLTEVTSRVADYLEIPNSECRYRAVCETATYIATKLPTINEWAKKVSGAFFLNLANPYSKAWINGMMQIDCATTYVYCEVSPFKTMINKFVAKK